MAHSNNSASTCLDLVRSEEWCVRFLGALVRMEGFGTLVDRSRRLAANIRAKKLERIRLPAQRLVASYPRYELAIARQYYNNEHLIHFWRSVNQEIDRLVDVGAITREFPLFQVKAHVSGLTYEAVPIPVWNFVNIEIHKTQDEPFLFTWRPGGNSTRPQINRESVLDGGKALDTLFGKLALLHNVVIHGFTGLYNIFLMHHRKQKDIVWDYYRIHYFLDNYLYLRQDGASCRASFGDIFFNSNLLELRVFLKHHLANRQYLSLQDVDDFLERQRQYYLRRAVTISLEENEHLNHRHDLFRYDPERGIVVPEDMTDEMRQAYRTAKIDPYGLLKLDGCPYAKSKGVKANALLETYEHFDKLMLHLLSRCPEFKELFAAPNAVFCWVRR